MALMKYFVFVGSALILGLFAMNWLLPAPTAEPVYSSIGRPVIRISSIETLPERVVFDTSIPYMPPSSSVVRVAAPSRQSAFTFEQITPGSLPAFSMLAQVTPKTIIEKRDPAKVTAKRDPVKRVATNRVAAPAPIAAVKNYPAREAEQDIKPPIKTTFLDEVAGRFGQLFKVN
jgi:hypothetical protein